MKCVFVGCERAAIRDGNRCSDHQLRWIPGAAVDAPRKPEWVRRRETVGLPAKDFTRSAA